MIAQKYLPSSSPSQVAYMFLLSDFALSHVPLDNGSLAGVMKVEVWNVPM
jgi:hypothetical protein